LDVTLGIDQKYVSKPEEATRSISSPIQIVVVLFPLTVKSIGVD